MTAQTNTNHLVYLTDDEPGFRRRKQGSGFRYFDTEDRPITDPEVVARIDGIVIPPAWTSVWIAPIANAHLQATGRDDKGRKQYRYHPKWRQRKESTKFRHLVAFAKTLPTIRAAVEADLHRHDLPREKVLAALVQLLDETHIRIGNDEYARANKSYGLTTLRNRHVHANSTSVQFSFRGKSGKEHKMTLHDRRLARIIHRCHDLPGQRLFSYLDDTGGVHQIGSTDVNAYMREITGADVTAKDFRTWAGTVLAVSILRHLPVPEDDATANREMVAATDAVAEELGNTRAVARASYIHPKVFDGYRSGALQAIAPDNVDDIEQGGLNDDERVTLALLSGG